MAVKSIDWEAVEADYRAGMLSLREIGEAHGVSHVMVSKKAKALGWVRDLSAKIRAKADALVNASEVNASVTNPAAEREIVDANAETQASVRVSHRRDITRMRALVLRLLSECEAESADPELFAEIGEILRKPDDNGTDKLNDAYLKAISLPTRIKGVKELADTLKTLVALEREAYNIKPVEEDPANRAVVDKDDLARRVIYMLAERAAGKP